MLNNSTKYFNDLYKNVRPTSISYSSNLMKLLYCAMFLLRMSAQGPRTLSNLTNILLRTRSTLSYISPCPVQLHALQVGLGRHSGGPGPVQHEGDLPEVVGGSEDSNLLTVLSLVSELSDGGVPTIESSQ